MSGNLGTRVELLEAKMEWAKREFQGIHDELRELKSNQNRMMEFMTERFFRIEERFARTDAQFVEVHREISGLYGQISGIHRSIALQTRWILVALLGGAVLYPLVLRLMERFLP